MGRTLMGKMSSVLHLTRFSAIFRRNVAVFPPQKRSRANGDSVSYSCLHIFGCRFAQTEKDAVGFNAYCHGGGSFPVCGNTDQQKLCCSPGGA
ncbi:hypothetical protein MHYP_G00343800 [Metynnis hypsauchen]